MSDPAMRTGVLLINLGSPDRPDAPAVRRFLNEFLSDRRVVEIPPIVWQPILKAFVLTRRPAKSAENYQKIWDQAENDSPLRVITRRQADALKTAFGPDVLVDYAMRYGNPSIASRLEAMRDAGCRQILLAPLYPQYASSTTGTVLQQAFSILGRWRWMPAVRTLPPYYADPAFIEALAVSVRRQLETLPFEPEKIILSCHGLPKLSIDLGDPYYHHCHEMARLLRAELGWTEADMPLAFQSRFGRAEWLQPYTEEVLKQLAASGTRKVAVLAPAFAADCVETLEEIAITARHTFEAAGGTHFASLTCLNDSEEGLTMLKKILHASLAGWINII